MRPPLEYGDNFPVTAASWDPTVPWRFPRSAGDFHRPTLFSQMLPWITLGLGVTLGMLWMSWRMELPDKGPESGSGRSPSGRQEVLGPRSVAPAQAVPAVKSYRPRSRLT